MTILEKIGSRATDVSAKEGSVKLEAFIMGSDNETVVFAQFQAWAPNVRSGLVLEKLSINQEAPGVWTGIANYGRPEDQEPEKPQFGEVTFTFETGGGKQKITNAPLADTAPTGYNSEASSAGPALNFKGGINVGDDMQVEGVEILVPQLTFEVSTKVPGGNLTMSFARTMAGLTGNVNSRKFLDCDRGTLLFEGASGSYKVGENIDRELKFKFSYSPNKKNITIGDIKVAEKRGWQYLWVHYRKSSDGKFVTMQPYKAFVHDVYEEADFRRYLGFG